MIKRKKNLYEILVPAYSNEGKKFSVLAWANWEGFLVSRSGGFTKLSEVSGVWVDEDKVYKDTNIPYRALLTRPDYIEALKYAKETFNQKAIFSYEVSEKVLIYS